MSGSQQSDLRHHAAKPLLTMPLRREGIRAGTRTVSSDSLFRGDHEIGIEHRGSFYRLKITRRGKLILNK